MLGTALRRLTGVVLPLVLGLGAGVAGDAGEGTAHGAGDTVSGARCKVVELALGLLLLARQVLLATGLLERLMHKGC